ncbi:hypothetical protein CHLRE_01g040900v5 [Chlamydomonas reinhardtii]|uniref:Uncharacterized protein n=1 Tax=Chlamydomonas reinhardtii TaxID=3055 RepID=A0A2K3E7E4_CHLRE|nr:uncharacterized protein CHLRE_01g040900v5 [Chlamydomonas reinhardtii]PNW88702.1 hypothetical protein CHLRE_01g040900v5 [Chlamydomonas reinhardtii]
MDGPSTSSSTPAASTSESRTWSNFGWSIAVRLHAAWACFDKWAGWLIGLDNSPYQWAVAEYQLQKAEEERELQRRLKSENLVRRNMEEGAGLEDDATARTGGAGDAGSSGGSAGGGGEAQRDLEMTRPHSNAISR